MRWFFSRQKQIRSTHEVETLRNMFRDDYEAYQKVEKSPDLKRFGELKEYVTSPLFHNRRKEIEQLSYKNSDYYKAEKRYKELLKSEKLRAFYMIRDSKELGGYLNICELGQYKSYMKLRTIVKSANFDKKLHILEYTQYRKLLADTRIKAALKMERNRKFRFYMEVKDTGLPQEFERLSDFIKTDEFKQHRIYLLNKKRYLTTEDYQLLCEYEKLKVQSDIVKYFALKEDSFFNNMIKWELVLEDDFKQGRLDDKRWITRYYAGERFLNDTYGVGTDVQLYTPDNVSLEDSAVCLNFRKESIIGKYWDEERGIREKKFEYTSGILSTATSFRQAYGRFEAKIKLNHSDITECFWMKGETKVPHISIMRNSGKGLFVGACSPYSACPDSSKLNIHDLGLGNDYYIFTLEWTKDKMVWRINDFVVKEVQNDIPDVPMYLLFSFGTNKEPAGRNVPGRMEIDWVRVYKQKE